MSRADRRKLAFDPIDEAARQWGLGLERATQVGSAVATAAIEVIGTQEYSLPRGPFLERFAAAFGTDAADEVAPHLPG